MEWRVSDKQERRDDELRSFHRRVLRSGRKLHDAHASLHEECQSKLTGSLKNVNQICRHYELIMQYSRRN